MSAVSTAVADVADTSPEMTRLLTRRTSLGSTYLAFYTDTDTVLALTRLRLEDAFRRVVLDPARGLVLLMSPSREHEVTTRDIDEVVKETAKALGLDGRALGSTRWRRPSDPQKSGAEPDDCYYLGENAVAYLRAEARGKGQAFADAHPPDLVVEVDVTHFDVAKQAFYRDLRVPEYWQVQIKDGELGATFLDLQAAARPAPLAVSQCLPGMTPTALCECLQALKTHSLLAAENALRQTLQAHGVAASTPSPGAEPTTTTRHHP